MSEVEELTVWLNKQEEKPLLHINGADHPSALLTVDFGQPLSGVSLSNERGNELSSLLKEAGRSLSRRKGALRVNFDNQRGVFWVSLAG